jgi:hypothetical protein
MVRQPDATMQATPQDNQLMSKHRVLSLKPQLRLEWQAQDGQNDPCQLCPVVSPFGNNIGVEQKH